MPKLSEIGLAMQDYARQLTVLEGTKEDIEVDARPCMLWYGHCISAIKQVIALRRCMPAGPVRFQPPRTGYDGSIRSVSDELEVHVPIPWRLGLEAIQEPTEPVLIPELAELFKPEKD